MEYISCLGQMLMGATFLVSAFTDVRDYKPLLGLMNKKNIPLSKIALPLAVTLKVIAGTAIIFNFCTFVASMSLVGFVLIANIIFHPFWRYQDIDRKREFTQFVTYLMVIAGLMVLAGTSVRL